MRVALSLLIIFLTSCGDRVQAISPHAISSVQQDIRRQVDIYQEMLSYEPFFIRDGSIVVIDRTPGNFVCGNGNIDYQISQIRADLTVSLTESAGITLSAAGTTPSLTTIAVSAEANTSRRLEQTLRFHLWPIRRPPHQPLTPPADEASQRDIIARINAAPIAAALMNLRNQQIVSAMRSNPFTSSQNRVGTTCFTNFDPLAPTASSGNFFALALALTDVGGGGVKVSVGIAAIGIDGRSVSTSGNTLTVFFDQSGLSEVQEAAARRASACAPGRTQTAECIGLMRRFRELIDERAIQGTLRIPGLQGPSQ